MFAKKNLVAAAALLALVGAAQAQSSVKLYGYLEADVGSYKAVGGKTTTKVQSGDMMTSFIGFSGVEDLGSGLKAEFALESFIGGDTGANVTNQAGQFWSRASWVALSGGFGKVILGQYDNANFTAGYLYNPFGSSMTFSPTMRHFYDLGSTTRGTPGTYNLNKTDTGWVNSITYETPVFAGFAASLQFSPKESSAAGDKNSYAVSASYNNGPLSVMGVYTDAGKAPKTNTINGVDYLPYPVEYRSAMLGASYDFGVVKAFGQYTRFKYYSNGLFDLDVNDAFAGEVSKAGVWQLGVSVPVSASGSVLASYGQAKYKGSTGGSASDKILSLGYDHALSKRTNVFAAFTNEKLTDEKSGRAFAVGVKHNF
jgi:predicted porin